MLYVYEVCLLNIKADTPTEEVRKRQTPPTDSSLSRGLLFRMQGHSPL